MARQTYRSLFIFLVFFAGSVLDACSASAKAPYHGTIFLEKDIITAADPTAFKSLDFKGTGQRSMFDRRIDRFSRVDAWLFTAQFRDSTAIEVQVNREFEREEAEKEALFYLTAIGRIPQVLRSKVETVWIHKGNKPFGGGNNNLLIHVEQGQAYARDGILEETFVHEAAHTSMDGDHAEAPAWLEAQRLDANFISQYAQDNPLREDVAESYLLHFAIRHRPRRVSDELKSIVEKTIPNRLRYFDMLTLNLSPCVDQEPIAGDQRSDTTPANSVAQQTPGDNWPLSRSFASPYAVQAAASDNFRTFAVSNTQVAVYERSTGELLGTSKGEAQHLNSAFLHEGRLYCAHSNYPQQPEQSEIRVFDPETGELKIFRDFGQSSGSLTWAVYRDESWWCHFAFYGAENNRSYLARFDSQWRELGRWTFPQSILSQLGQYSLSGGIWLGNELLVTGHDDRLLFRLVLPSSGNELIHSGTDRVPFTGQGFAFDPATGGLVGIDRSQRSIQFADPPRSRPLRLRLLSYNIHHGEGVDGVLDLQRIANVIRQANPDLVALQEVDRKVSRTQQQDQPAILAHETSMMVAFGSNLKLQGGDYGNAILSRFPLLAQENLHLPSLHQGEQRGLLVTQIQLPDNRPTLWFLATHLDHRRDGAERLASADRIIEFIQPKGNDIVVLAGDLNERRSSPGVSKLLEVFTLGHDDELATIPVQQPESQIDFIMTRPTSRWRPLETHVLEESIASDHRPILAVFELLPSVEAATE